MRRRPGRPSARAAAGAGPCRAVVPADHHEHVRSEALDGGRGGRERRVVDDGSSTSTRTPKPARGPAQLVGPRSAREAGPVRSRRHGARQRSTAPAADRVQEQRRRRPAWLRAGVSRASWTRGQQPAARVRPVLKGNIGDLLTEYCNRQYLILHSGSMSRCERALTADHHVVRPARTAPPALLDHLRARQAGPAQPELVLAARRATALRRAQAARRRTGWPPPRTGGPASGGAATTRSPTTVARRCGRGSTSRAAPRPHEFEGMLKVFFSDAGDLEPAADQHRPHPARRRASGSPMLAEMSGRAAPVPRAPAPQRAHHDPAGRAGARSAVVVGLGARPGGAVDVAARPRALGRGSRAAASREPSGARAGPGRVALDRSHPAGPDPRRSDRERLRSPCTPGQDRPTRSARRTTARGTNFALFSEVADRVELCLFGERRQGDPGRADRGRRVRLALLPPAGAAGPAVRLPRARARTTRRAGSRCNPNKLLLDPYAKATHGDIDWDQSLFGYTFGDERCPTRGRNDDDSAAHMTKGVVINPYFDWEGDRRPRIPYNETFIYEAHVKGLTQLHPDIPPEQRGHVRRPGPPGRHRPPAPSSA